MYGANPLFYTVHGRQPRPSLVGEDNHNPTYRIYMANQKNTDFLTLDNGPQETIYDYQASLGSSRILFLVAILIICGNQTGP